MIYFGSRSPCLQPDKEHYVNTYGDYLDSPFFEDDDRKCRQTCNNMANCKGYTYDPTSGRCYLNSDKKEYLLPYSDHFLYPYFDPYLYDNAWWLYASHESPKVLSEEQALLPEDTVPKPLELLDKGRAVTHVMPPWTQEDYFSRGYRNNRYYGHGVHHYNNDEVKKEIKFSGRVGEYLGGGHGGRVRGNMPSGNTFRDIFKI